MAKTTIPGEYLADGGITTAKIADDAVTSAKLDTNIDLAGTLDVTGATTLDSTLSVAGDITLLGFPESAYEIKGDLDGGVRFQAQAAETLAKGDVVYISGAAGDNTLVSKARSNSASTMPAFGLVVIGAASGSPVQVVTFGNLYGSGAAALNTSSYSVGDNLYVSAATAGALTATAPTGEANLIQNIGKVVRSHATNGVIKVGGAGRTNATPNLNQGKIFIGNASNQSVSSAYTLPIADGTDGQVLTTDGSGAVSFEALPASGPTFKTFGTDSIMIGDTTTGTIDAADSNTGVGVNVFAALTSGDNNTAVGFAALTTNTTGSNNTVLGMGGMNDNISGADNVAVGVSALYANTTASNNTAIGRLALRYNTTGGGNTAVGMRALTANTTASNNNSFGKDSLYANTTGAQNNAFGLSALQNNTEGSDNTAVGHIALFTNTTGGQNVAVGRNALGANTTASGNTAVGYNCMDANTTGNESAAFGYGALGAHTTGNSNTGLGYLSGQNLTNGGNNTFVGRSSGATYSAGTRSVAIGSFAAGGTGDKTGDSNISIGYIAGAALTSGADNVFIGDTAGNANTTGGGNTLIGRGAGASITTGNNNLCIGKGTDVNTGAATSRLGLGVALSLTGADQIKIGIASDFIVNTFISNATWSHSSDERLKKNITDDSLGLTFINKLRPVTYNWKPFEEQPEDIRGTASNKKDDRKYHGMIAQEVKQSLDDVGVNTFTGWTENEEGVQMISEQMFVYPLIKAVQELSTQVDELKSELLALKGE